MNSVPPARRPAPSGLARRRAHPARRETARCRAARGRRARPRAVPTAGLADQMQRQLRGQRRRQGARRLGASRTAARRRGRAGSGGRSRPPARPAARRRGGAARRARSGAGWTAASQAAAPVRAVEPAKHRDAAREGQRSRIRAPAAPAMIRSGSGPRHAARRGSLRRLADCNFVVAAEQNPEGLADRRRVVDDENAVKPHSTCLQPLHNHRATRAVLKIVHIG